MLLPIPDLPAPPEPATRNTIPPELTLNQLAELSGSTYRTCKKRLAAAGIKPVRQDDRAGYYSPPEALAAIFRDSSTAKERDLSAERARLASRQAERIELELAERRGALIPAPLVIDLCSTMYAGVKAKLLAITAKVKARNMDLDQRPLDDIDYEIRSALQDILDDGMPESLRRRLATFTPDGDTEAAQGTGDEESEAQDGR